MMDGIQNSVWEIFDSRVSHRSFTSEPINDDIIEFLLTCGITAPSNGNMQPWEFIVIRDEGIKTKIVECTYFGYFSKGGDHQDWILDAPVIIVACANQKRTKARYGQMGMLGSIIDTAAAIENILLATAGIGLASCWVGGFNEKRVKKVLNVPRQVKPVGLLPIGHPKGNGERKHRLPIKLVKIGRAHVSTPVTWPT